MIYFSHSGAFHCSSCTLPDAQSSFIFWGSPFTPYFCRSLSKHPLNQASFSFRFPLKVSTPCSFALWNRPLGHVCLSFFLIRRHKRFSNRVFLFQQSATSFRRKLMGIHHASGILLKSTEKHINFALSLCFEVQSQVHLLSGFSSTSILRVLFPSYVMNVYNSYVFLNAHRKLKIRKEQIIFFSLISLTLTFTHAFQV